jgi:hypothetical protein
LLQSYILLPLRLLCFSLDCLLLLLPLLPVDSACC